MYGSERLDKNPRSMVFVPVDVTVATAFVDVGLPRCRFLRRCACQRLCFRTAVHCACLRRVAACSGIPASSLVFCQPPIGCLRSRSSIAYRCIVRHRSASSPRAFTWIDLRTFIALLRACRLGLSLSLSLLLSVSEGLLAFACLLSHPSARAPCLLGLWRARCERPSLPLASVETGNAARPPLAFRALVSTLQFRRVERDRPSPRCSRNVSSVQGPPSPIVVVFGLRPVFFILPWMRTTHLGPRIRQRR